ncbi:hypothetical protein [Streptomyces sp. CC219B]|nr:hypothetical protein [Streptomyces sp. CC219B]
MEYENHQGGVCRVDWADGAWRVTEGLDRRAMGLDEVRRFVEESLL